MKKKLANTKCTVKLRKSEYRDEWYLIIDIYPVYRNSDGKPYRIKEGVNRSITTPIWDKNRIAKTNPDGSVTYRPKRDNNGIIMCRSAVDNESCIYADKVRELRQREYDNQELYTESEVAMAAQNERSESNFIDCENAVSSTTPANADNLFDNEQTVTEATAVTDQPKQLRIGKQQRKSDFAEFKATFLAPAKLVNRHALNIESNLWDQLERVSRILGDRGTTVSSYANAILAEHLKLYADNIEIWRKL